MPRQPDYLFGRRDLSLAPDLSRSEPRLWVRRLAIWCEPGTAPRRDYTFHAGLNVIWSLSVRETRDDQEGAIGHGSGKTLLCRLIRYCLGERRFAPEEQRAAIGAEFMEGVVGAEVMLDGTCWAILRPLGHRHRHVAMAGGDLDAIAAGDGTHTGIEPFIAAVEDAFFSKDVAALVPGGQAWLTELAWLSRDQDCNFSKLQEWRDVASGSDSPARNLPTDEAKFLALRVFLKAFMPEERALGDEIRELEARRDKLKQEAAHRLWEAEEEKKRLAPALDLKEVDLEGGLAAEALKQAARRRLAQVAEVPAGTDLADPTPLREELRKAQAEATSKGEALVQLTTRLDEKDKNFSRMRKEVFGLMLSTDGEENPPCPICDVPVSRVLVESCKLTDRIVDLDTIRQKRENHQRALEKEKADLDRLQVELPEATEGHKEAQGRVAALEDQLRRVEEARATHGEVWYQARRMVDAAERYERLLDAYGSVTSSLDTIVGQLEGKREQLAGFRERQKPFLARMSEIFDYIVRQLVGGEASGSIRLTGNGLEAKIQMGGERETPGTKCIKVLAFDLTALCLSIEKGAQIAPFFIHDSPRTADLDPEVYDRLFRLVKSLSEEPGPPLFQYIITTTTPPPLEFREEPWTVVKLKGAPAQERLLGCDL